MSPEDDVLLLRASGADSEPEGWEVVSSSSEGGEGGERSAARAAEEAALATSFLLGELSPPASPPSEGAAGEAGPGPSSGSEAGEHGSGGATAAVELAEGQALAPCSPLLEAAAACGAMLPQQPGTPSQGMRPMGLRPSAPGQAKGAGADGSGGGGDASAAGLPRAESVYLLVVRSDEQEGLQAAVAALEKRAAQRELELSLARRRLRTTQAVAAERAREARTLRKLVLLTASVCAFLGLRSLAGGPACTLAGGAAAARAGKAEDELPADLASAVGLPPRLQASLQGLVAVQVEPLPAAA